MRVLSIFNSKSIGGAVLQGGRSELIFQPTGLNFGYVEDKRKTKRTWAWQNSRNENKVLIKKGPSRRIISVKCVFCPFLIQKV